MSVLCEQIAAKAFREWMLLQLPAKVTEVNALRAAVLKSPWAGPYNIGAGKTLGLSFTPAASTFTAIPLTAGAAQTSAAIAADINAVLPGRAAADADGRWYVTGDAPLAATPSKAWLRGGINTDANTLFGFDSGGEKESVTALVAPGSRGVADGKPLQPDFGPNASPGGSPIVIIIGDRHSRPARPGPRGDEYIVTLDVAVLRIEPLQLVHRNREAIQAALRCVREVFSTDAGRQLGRAATGDVSLVTETGCSIAAQPFQFTNTNTPNPLFDAATLLLEVRVFERPAS